MRKFFTPNIGRAGRLIRGVTAIALIISGVFAWRISVPLSVGLLISGGFVLCEAFRGWCIMRACGIKTRL
jgi:hypothetical protein